MTLLSHFLIATALIAVLILFRMFADRSVLRSRLHKDQNRQECEQTGCFRGCDQKKE